jgi:Holliday junction resolvase RusA-like endonuclease
VGRLTVHVDSTQGVLATVGRPDAGGHADVPAVLQQRPDEPAGEGALREADGRGAVPGELARVEAGRVISFSVLGQPAPKGSSRAFTNKRTGRAVVAPSGSAVNKERLANWGSAVRHAIAIDLFDGSLPNVPLFVDTAVSVTIVFHVARPKGHWGKGKRAGTILPSAPARPATKPDIDKLARTTLDAMTGSVFDDDSRIADLALSKRWAMPGREGASITVQEARSP